MSGGDGRAWWRGSVFDRRTVDMLEEAEQLAGVRIEPSQGSYQGGAVEASAGTHDGGGAVDVKTRHLQRADADRIVYAMRTVGFAAWYRDKGFSTPHIHGIAVACPDLSNGARGQVRQYLDGRDGLAQRGPDTGPRDFPGGPGVTWEQYTAGKQQPEPEPEGAPDMILISRKSDGRTYLLGLTGPAYIHNPQDLNEIRKALKDPNHTATVGDGTFDRLAKYAAGGALP